MGEGAARFNFTQPHSDQDFYSSRDSDAPGIGFPSSSQALALLPRNFNDANGYYEILGIEPWASIKEISKRCRELLAKFHPDGSHPDVESFIKIEEIYRVLTDPVQKEIYDNTPRGAYYMDSEIKAMVKDQIHKNGGQVPPEMRFHAPTPPADTQAPEEPDDEPLELDDPDVVEGEVVSEDVEAEPTPEVAQWDYFSNGFHKLDGNRANDWYPFLLQAARAHGYQGTVKLHLTNGRKGFHPRTGLVRIPRGVVPNLYDAQKMFDVAQ